MQAELWYSYEGCIYQKMTKPTNVEKKTPSFSSVKFLKVSQQI